MSKFNLQNAADFGRVVQSTLGSIAAPLLDASLAGRDPSKWDILEATFKDFKFHIFSSSSEYQAGLSNIQDTGGRRKIKYSFPYRDGQTTDDLGRRGESFSVEALIHGSRYSQAMQGFFKVLADPKPGVLIHPVRGNITCVVEEYQITHSFENRKAFAIRIVFAEHSFTLADTRSLGDTSTRGLLSKLLDAFATVDAVITNITGTVLFVNSLKNRINEALQIYKDNYAILASRINTTFNGGGASTFPTLLPVNQGGLRNNDGTLAGNVTTNDVLSSSTAVLDEQTATALAADDLKKQVAAARVQLQQILDLIEQGADGQGALTFYDDVLSLKRTAIDMQLALEKGIASSKATVIQYVTPRLMSLREVCFANGLQVSRVVELDLLNPQLESINYLPPGTSIQVPIS